MFHTKVRTLRLSNKSYFYENLTAGGSTQNLDGGRLNRKETQKQISLLQRLLNEEESSNERLIYIEKIATLVHDYRDHTLIGNAYIFFKKHFPFYLL